MAGLTAQADGRNAEELARLAHTLAGSCANLGGQQMLVAALAIERAATSRGWAEMPALLTTLHQARARFHEALIHHGLIPP